jgi:ABC-2 type transport system permease protein
VKGYVAALHSLLAVPMGAYAASRIAPPPPTRPPGVSHSCTPYPVGRTLWAAIEAATVAAAAVVLAATAGLAT